MKKTLIAVCALLAFSACKNTSDESKAEVKTIATSGNDDATVADNDPLTTTSVKETTTEEKTVPMTAGSVKKATDSKGAASYASFGKKITVEKALTREEMLKKYKAMKPGDTLNVKFASTIKEVCKKKGCWMSMALPGEKESFVRFKDYGFFVPLNADKAEAIISGKAYVEVVPVSELQHYAKDGGKSEADIAKITEPKVTYAFQADGVLIRE